MRLDVSMGTRQHLVMQIREAILAGEK